METKQVPTIFEDLNSIEYKKAWDYQEQTMESIISAKKEGKEVPSNKLIFCEHPHVYTLGKSGAQNNLLINQDFLDRINATYFKSNRGGDITYHGPGQIVGYPIFDLEQFGFQVKKYIEILEEAIIKTIAEWGIEGHRLEGATGVWLDIDKPGQTRKICAMGVRVSRWVTMHGFALNDNTQLDYFNHINPCGFVDKGVTSMEKELGKKLNFEEVKEVLKAKLAEEFNLNYI
jgi:lipoyl(octanoyl) transferase